MTAPAPRTLLTFGGCLHLARIRAGYTQQALADMVSRTGRTIRNWESDYSFPDGDSLAALRRLFGRFDFDGDDVERAVMLCGLTEDRQREVIGFYNRQRREQQAMEQGRLT